MKIGDWVLVVAKHVPGHLRNKKAQIIRILDSVNIIVEFPGEFSYYSLGGFDYVTEKVQVF